MTRGLDIDPHRERPSEQIPLRPAAPQQRRSRSQEALRNEIEKDASALLELTGAHEALALRKVDVARLESLRNAAQALAGKLSNRAVKKGERITATKEEREAIAAQSATWQACYRLLAAVGRTDDRIAQLLKEASRKRK